jgi:hypothetical protein
LCLSGPSLILETWNAGKCPLSNQRLEGPLLEWSFTDDQRRGWVGSSIAEPPAKEQGKFDVTVRLARTK